MTRNYIISVIMLVGNVIKLCNPVSKVPVCMADQAKLLVAALQCKSSVNYMQLKTEQSQGKMFSRVQRGLAHFTWYWLAFASSWLADSTLDDAVWM